MKNNNLTPIMLTPQPQMRDRVFEKLRQAIITGELQPGERLVERTLAEQLGVSRTPVREAISMLELEGLLTYLPKTGAVVSRVSDAEVLEIYQIRAVLEGLAARLAAENITGDGAKKLIAKLETIEKAVQQGDTSALEQAHQEFNDIIYRAAASPRLYNMITTLVDYVRCYTKVGYSQPGRIKAASQEHRQLVDAIVAQNGPQAEGLARDHINNSKQAYFQTLAKR